MPCYKWMRWLSVMIYILKGPVLYFIDHINLKKKTKFIYIIEKSTFCSSVHSLLCLQIIRKNFTGLKPLIIHIQLSNISLYLLDCPFRDCTKIIGWVRPNLSFHFVKKQGLPWTINVFYETSSLLEKTLQNHPHNMSKQ